MSFLAMLIAVLLEKLSGVGELLHRDTWVGHLDGVLRGLGLSGLPLLLLAVVLPAVVAQLVLAVLQPAVFGLAWIVAGAALLLYSFGRGDLEGLQERYRAQCRREDFEGAWLTASAELPWLEAAPADEQDPEKVHARVQRALLYEGFQRWFGVLFYFLLLGPAGAFAYRLCHLAGDDDSRGGLLFYVDWLPARALAATFSLTGDFTASVDELALAVGEAGMPAQDVLYTVGMAATGDDKLVGEVEFSGERAAALGEAMAGLLRRAGVCWVLVISVVVILA